MLVGVETTPLVAATLEMQLASGRVRVPMAVRCGLTADYVILHEGDDYIGHAVNVAARLCDIAPGGEVWAGAGHRRAPAQVGGGALLARRSPSGGSSIRCGCPGSGWPSSRGRSSPTRSAGSRSRVGSPTTSPVTPSGNPVLFCSESCRDTWERRPKERPDGQGSLRIPLIGS